MSAFIVISVKDSLNWIVDGIKECRPHNPTVITYLSTGKIKKKEEDKYLYEYTVFSKHVGDKNVDRTIAEKIESDIPRNLLTNQISQFLHVCENEGEQINIFLLDNPINDADFEHSSWLVDEIRAVYKSHKVTNFQLVRVLFSYQIDNPTNVNLQVSKMILKQLTKINIDDSDDFQTRILYIDNQNRSGAAMCIDKEGHDIMIPRMLCDLMMLLSNKDDSYNVVAAINGQTRMFAVGYSECMYYHDDVFHFYELAGKRDLLEYLLKAENVEESLDYEKHPIGLESRIKRLEPKYAEVPYDLKIDSFNKSIDKAIDDIIVSFKDDIKNIRQEALVIAAKKDEEDTKMLQIVHMKESGLLPIDLTDEDIEKDYIKIAKETGIDISNIIVSTATEKADRDYPKYIDRHQIYEEYLVEDEEGDDFEGTDMERNVQAYNCLIHFVQSSLFKKYIRRQCELANSSPAIVSNDSLVKPKRKECFLKRLFCKQYKSEVKSVVSTEIVQANRRDWQQLRDCITSISTMLTEREKYYALKEKVKMMREELKEKNDNLHLFKLTEHCSSVDNLIDLDKLKEYHASGKDARIAKIVNNWDSRDEEDRSYETLFEELQERTKWDIFNFYYINWSEPFDFIKPIDLTKICESIKRRSQPYVNTYTLGPIAENLTSYNFYTDNQKWHEEISQKKVNLKDDNMVSCTFSQHICSKICMFQFLQMTRELIEGLVDCSDNE